MTSRPTGSLSSDIDDQYRFLIETASHGLLLIDAGGCVILANSAAENQFGYDAGEMIGLNATALIPDGYADRLATERRRHGAEIARRAVGDRGELIGRRRDGSDFPVQILIGSSKSGLVAVRTGGLELAFAAEHDVLTGLPNRLLLGNRITRAIILAKRRRHRVAVLFLDLDGFKRVNDSLGHAVGDRLLQSVATRLLGAVRASDTVSRQGGDEFVILLPDVSGAPDVAALAEKLLRAVADPHDIAPNDLHTGVSIGASLYPDDGLDAETLIKNADTAMYQAKEGGRHTFRFFAPAMRERAIERQTVEEDLRRAVARGEFTLRYQPQIDVRGGAITGAEALIRWKHPSRGLLTPDAFIPIAEESGLMVPIGAWVLREACAQAEAWRRAGLPAISMAVNVSAVEFGKADFLAGILGALDDTGLDPRALELELTESMLMQHAESAVTVLGTLRDIGVRVAIDDFGTGFSSLSYLTRFPVDALKIDQSFIRQLGGDRNNAIVVTTIIGMAHAMDLRVIAEGVETADQLRFLSRRRCEEAQGYLFSRPMPAADFVKLIAQGVSKGAGESWGGRDLPYDIGARES